MENGEKTKKINSLIKRVEFYIGLALILIGAVAGWTALQAKVERNEERINENRNQMSEIGSKLDDINDFLNNVEFGLPVLGERIRQLEKRTDN